MFHLLHKGLSIGLHASTCTHTIMLHMCVLTSYAARMCTCTHIQGYYATLSTNAANAIMTIPNQELMLSGSQPKSLDRTQVRYVCGAGIEPESIPTYRALRTRH